MSSSFESLDDDTDNSLLISPTVERSNVEAADRRFSAVTAMDQREEREFNSVANYTNLEASNVIVAKASTTDESILVTKTPQKSKFNHTSVLEELECLAPTPATTKKLQRLGTNIQDNFEEGEGSILENFPSKNFTPPPSSVPSILATVKETATTLSDEIIEAHIAASPLAEIPNPMQSSHLKSSFHPSFNWEDDAATTALPDGNGISVFRQPCIRRSNSNESFSVRLNLGHPVNESYDIADANFPSGVGYGEQVNEHLIKDSDLSMEVEKRLADANRDEFVLEETSRVEKLDMNFFDVTEARDFEQADVSHETTEFHANLALDGIIKGDEEVHHHNSKGHPPVMSRPWDILDSDDSEEDTMPNERQSDYVEKMNESIASYFSSHGGTIPLEGNNHNSLEVSADLDDSTEGSNMEALSMQHSIEKDAQQSSFYEGTVKHQKPREISYRDKFDVNEHPPNMQNLLTMGDDATQIYVDQCADNSLTDSGKCTDDPDGSLGFLISIKSTHGDDHSNSVQSDGKIQMQTGASTFGKDHSLLAVDTRDPETLCDYNQDGSLIEKAPHLTKLTTEYDLDADAKTSTASTCIGAQEHAYHPGDDMKEISTCGVTHDRAGKNDSNFAIEPRDEASTPQINSDLQSEHPILSDAYGFDVENYLSGDREDIKISSRADIHREIYASNASIGSFSDNLSPIWGSTSSHNSLLDSNSPDLRIELTSDNFNNVSGDVKLIIDGERNQAHSIYHTTSSNSVARTNSRSDNMSVKASGFHAHSRQPIRDKLVYSLSNSPDLSSIGTETNDVKDKSAEVIENEIHVQTSTTGTVNEQQSARTRSENKRVSLEDLSSYQRNFTSTSSAFLERLREGAELRKREVTRGRYSMERKEHILSEEKNVRVLTLSMPSVLEEMSMKAVSLHEPSVEGTVKACGRKEGYPNRRFKATPPATYGSISSTALLGAKRKSSTVFRPIPTQNNSNLKNLALNAEPPKRLLSGKDASTAKEISLRKRIQEEEARIRRESTFKARPLPATTRTMSFEPLVGEHLLVQGKSVQRGKENVAFIPHSSHRANERKLYDIAKAEREQERRMDQIEQRNRRIDQTKAEINELKKFLR